VSQISPPMRILLVGAFVFLVAWFTILKPKPVTAESDVPAPSTAQTAYGKAVNKAKSVAEQAVATATPTGDSDDPAAPAATPEPAAEPAIAIPDEELAKLPKTVASALKARKILVLGVFADGETNWRPMADDDRYVRSALRKSNRYHGDVVVKYVDISELSTYGSLVNDLNVVQAPSVVVIDRELKGRVLTGYVDRISINQTIADARDATTTPRIADPYLRELNAFCGDHKLRFDRWSRPTIRGEKPTKAAIARLNALNLRSRRQLARTDAPAKWRPLKVQMLDVLVSGNETAKAIAKLARGGEDDGVAAKVRHHLKAARKLDRRFDELGITNCVINRRS